MKILIMIKDAFITGIIEVMRLYVVVLLLPFSLFGYFLRDR